MDLHDHEKPILLVLKEGEPAGHAFLALLDHPDVATHQFPPPWYAEKAGVDLPEAMPDLETITCDRLTAVLDTLIRLHTKEDLDRIVNEMWREVDEQVRAFFLKRPVLTTFASILRMAPKTKDMPPADEFVEGQIFMHRFEMEYRLHRAWEKPNPVAPEEEGSLVLYPFDPQNAAARRDGNLDEGPAIVLEMFAYGPARDRHRKVLEEVAKKGGWRVIDTATIEKPAATA